jgi:hypothetical protein
MLCVSSLSSSAKPLKVFILAGQSNMEGHAEISTFDYIGKDPKTATLLKDMRNPDGTPRVCVATFDVMSPRHCDELGLKLKSLWAVDIHDLLAVLLPPASIARILPVMTNCCDTYHTGKYTEQ